MKLLNTISMLSLFGFTSLASAQEKCDSVCDKAAKVAKKSEKCDTECETECDSDGAMKTYIVAGMTCSKCSDKVKASLGEMEGLTVKKVCHKSGKVMVSYDDAKIEDAKVTEAISATGFKVAGESINIPVSGMKCGSCSSKLTEALTKMEGCSNVSVCHKSGNASVVIDTEKTSKEKVMEVIKASGYKAGEKMTQSPVKDATKAKG